MGVALNTATLKRVYIYIYDICVLVHILYVSMFPYLQDGRNDMEFQGTQLASSRGFFFP